MLKYHTKDCPICGKTFGTSYKKKICCSERCRNALTRQTFIDKHGVDVSKMRRDAFRAQGLCGCGKLPQAGRQLCDKCSGFSRDTRRDIRAAVIKAYGSSCACCGEDNPIFLCVDHIDNNGAGHRRELGGRTTSRLYHWLVRNGFPKDNFRLLCFNCNSGRYINGGTCPHEDVRLKLVA